MRKRFVVSIALLPSLAMAQQVPAPQMANASATASATVTAPAPTASAPNGTQPLPPGLPPQLTTLSPSAPLNAKEKVAASLAGAWRNRADRPARGEDGVLRWTFGASLPSVVCSPLQVCDIALQSGEDVESIHVGDKVRWNVLPAVSGSGADRTTHLIVKPSDAGLVSSILVYTSKRTYSIKLISTQSQWTPMTAFTYPENAETAWAHYGATMTAGPGAPTARATAKQSGSDPAGADINLDYKISGSAPWEPVRVYAAAGKTYVEMPTSLRFGSAPAIVGLANDGGWFSSPSEQMLRYRLTDNRFVIDGLPRHFALIEGVGASQSRVDVRRLR